MAAVVENDDTEWLDFHLSAFLEGFLNDGIGLLERELGHQLLLVNQGGNDRWSFLVAARSRGGRVSWRSLDVVGRPG